VDKTLTLRPDAILMDMVMPVKTGFEAAREIRQQPEFKETAIIAISASVLEADQEESRVAGCDAFLPKPVKTGGLLDLLATHLKLSWITAKPEDEAESLLVPPPAEELAALHKLAKKGKIMEIQKQVIHLEELGEAYIPFARKLQALAKRFEIEQITTFVEQFIEER
jgi:CheY-like chemotaxis protein